MRELRGRIEKESERSRNRVSVFRFAVKSRVTRGPSSSEVQTQQGEVTEVIEHRAELRNQPRESSRMADVSSVSYKYIQNSEYLFLPRQNIQFANIIYIGNIQGVNSRKS
jgi:hypothetical protein